MSYPEETKIPEARFSNNRLRLSCNHLHLGLQTRRSGHRRVFSLFSARRQGPQWDSIVAFCQIRDLFASIAISDRNDFAKDSKTSCTAAVPAVILLATLYRICGRASSLCHFCNYVPFPAAASRSLEANAIAMFTKKRAQSETLRLRRKRPKSERNGAWREPATTTSAATRIDGTSSGIGSSPSIRTVKSA